MVLKLPRLPSGFKIINRDGSPTDTFQLWWNNVAGQLEANINAITAALEAADIAIAAAESAQASADAAQAAADSAAAAGNAAALEGSINNSGVINEAAPLQADDAGNILIPNHERAYGNPALNPTVPVTGASIGTGGTTGDIFYVVYSDPTRAGGAVTFGFVDDPADAVQTASTHSVGSVTIPAAGTSDGFYTRPRGV
jgi:hypothetical protein